jgi:hypothetical protein
MRNKYKPMGDIYHMVAMAIAGNQTLGNSPTTIRCLINDMLDTYKKDGCRVHDNYSQIWAIKRVRKLIPCYVVAVDRNRY